jgi:hypothetical protein
MRDLHKHQIKNKNSTMIITLTLSVLFAVNLLIGSSSTLQLSLAQKPAPIDSFSAKGYAGQEFVIPINPVQTPSSFQQFGLTPAIGSIISGNWSFAVINGQLQSFKWNSEAVTLSGKVNGTFSIDEIRNSTGALPPSNSNKIQLEGNHTDFKGIADINLNDRSVFHDVPVVVHLLNGKLVNLSIDPSKTFNVFSLPLFGIVTSLIH